MPRQLAAEVGEEPVFERGAGGTVAPVGEPEIGDDEQSHVVSLDVVLDGLELIRGGGARVQVVKACRIGPLGESIDEGRRGIDEDRSLMGVDGREDAAEVGGGLAWRLDAGNVARW